MKIPYGRQDISNDDIDAVIKVLKSDFLTQGPVTPKFEDSIASYCNVDHAFATNSATSALHIACLALGLGQGDILWTSPISFVASANCALYCGASIDFVDIDRNTFNMCIQSLEEKLKEAKQKGKLPKVIVPVHLCGQSCDMKKIKKLSENYGFKIIEDASHAIGAEYNDNKVGSCEYSDITVFSFHPVKIITTGEGGMAVTNQSSLAKKLELLRSHGITRDNSLFQGTSNQGWYYEQLELGFNYRMTDIHAALGLSQFSRLDEFVEKRNILASTYKKYLSGIEIDFQVNDVQSLSSYHLFVIKLDNEDAQKRDLLFSTLRDKGIGVNLHYIPIHLQPFYGRLGFKEGYLPNSENYFYNAISLPLFPALTANMQEEICNIIKDSL